MNPTLTVSNATAGFIQRGEYPGEGTLCLANPMRFDLANRDPKRIHRAKGTGLRGWQEPGDAMCLTVDWSQ